MVYVVILETACSSARTHVCAEELEKGDQWHVMKFGAPLLWTGFLFHDDV